MTYNEFNDKIRKNIDLETIFQNPGRGTSIVKKITDHRISYIRGKSTISIKFESLFWAYKTFKGGRVSSTELKVRRPEIFDSNARPAGHSCNCTFLFLLLQKIGYVDLIEGKGKKGSPFFVEIMKDESDH